MSDPLVFRPQVEKADIDCSNGIIHVIDTVHDGSVPASLVDLFNLVRTGGLARSESEWRDLADRVHLKLHDVAPFEVPFSDLVLCLNLDSLTEDT